MAARESRRKAFVRRRSTFGRCVAGGQHGGTAALLLVAAWIERAIVRRRYPPGWLRTPYHRSALKSGKRHVRAAALQAASYGLPTGESYGP